MFGVFSLLLMAPTQKDIIHSLKYFAVAFSIAYVLKIIAPGLYPIPKVIHDARGLGSLPGYELLCHG